MGKSNSLRTRKSLSLFIYLFIYLFLYLVLQKKEETWNIDFLLVIINSYFIYK
ncbi:MAG: hypothetical protein N7Q72_05700 [Spiroplasma sp. Tabriz.8]|nr:hypothetical protein [Spiroplasma sp. Tabriz.8]